MTQIYISFNWNDKKIYDVISADLSANYNVKSNSQKIESLDYLTQRVKQDILSSDIVFVIWSEQYSQSKWNIREISYAHLCQKNIIGIFIDETPWFSYLQNINISSQDWRSNYEKLFMYLNIILVSQEHKILRNKGVEWSILSNLLTQFDSLEGVTHYLNSYRSRNTISEDCSSWIQNILDIGKQAIVQVRPLLHQRQYNYIQGLRDRIRQSTNEKNQLQNILKEIQINKPLSPTIFEELQQQVEQLLEAFETPKLFQSEDIETPPSTLAVEVEEVPIEAEESVWWKVGKYAAMGVACYGFYKLMQGQSSSRSQSVYFEDQVASLNSMRM